MITGLLLILLFGNRSAILNAVLVFVFQLIFFGNKKNKVLRIFEIIIMVAMGFLLFSGNLLNLFGGILERFGMSSRTIEWTITDVLLSGKIVGLRLPKSHGPDMVSAVKET